MDPKMKFAGAAALAVVALGLAGWMGYSSLGGGRKIRSASQATNQREPGPDADNGVPGPDNGGRHDVSMDGPAPEWMQQRQQAFKAYQREFDFPSKDDAVEAFDVGATDLSLAAEQDSALGTLGLGARRGLVESWRAFMRPLVVGDVSAFEKAVADLGGVTQSGGSGQTGAAALFDRLSGYLEGSRLAMSEARIIEKDPENRRDVPMGMPRIKGMPDMKADVAMVPIMVGIMETVDDETGETMKIRDMNIPLGALFQDAAAMAAEGATMMEVWAPAKMAGVSGKKPDIGPSVFFVLDSSSGRWQPVAMRVSLASKKAASKLEGMMRGGRGRAKED